MTELRIAPNPRSGEPTPCRNISAFCTNIFPRPSSHRTVVKFSWTMQSLLASVANTTPLSFVNQSGQLWVYPVAATIASASSIQCLSNCLCRQVKRSEPEISSTSTDSTSQLECSVKPGLRPPMEPGQSGEENLSHSRWSTDARNHLSLDRISGKTRKNPFFLSLSPQFRCESTASPDCPADGAFVEKIKYGTNSRETDTLIKQPLICNDFSTLFSRNSVKMLHVIRRETLLA